MDVGSGASLSAVVQGVALGALRGDCWLGRVAHLWEPLGQTLKAQQDGASALRGATGKGSAHGDSPSSQHQAREETEAPQRTPGGRSQRGLPAVPRMYVDQTVRTFLPTSCLVPWPGGQSWSSPIRAGIRERPPCPK